MLNPNPKPKKPIRLKGGKMKALQRQVLERDNFTCLLCGAHTQDAPHHIIYRSNGGSDVIENLASIDEDAMFKDDKTSPRAI